MNRKMLLFIAIVNFYIINSGIACLINDCRDCAYKFLFALSLFSITAAISLGTYRFSLREDLLITPSDSEGELKKVMYTKKLLQLELKLRLR